MKIVPRKKGIGYRDGSLWVPKELVNVEGTKNALTFEAKSKRNDVRFVYLYAETADHLLVPRDYYGEQELPFEVVDLCPTEYPYVELGSKIVLDIRSPGKDVQQRAVKALLDARSGGVLQLACGGGKSVILLEVAARLHVPTIIIVDNDFLFEQWRKEILLHLSVAEQDIGTIRAQTMDWKKPIVVSTYQTLAIMAETMREEVRRWFGCICFEEGHHLGADTFSRSADLFYGRRYALTATPERRDGMHVVHQHHVGPVLFKDLNQELTPRVEFRWTGFAVDKNDNEVARQVLDCNGEEHLGKISSYLGSIPARTEKLVGWLRELEGQGRKVLVVSPGIAELANLLACWNGDTRRLQDIQPATPEQLGFPTVQHPIELSAFTVAKHQSALTTFRKRLQYASSPEEVAAIQSKIDVLAGKLQAHEAAQAIQKDLDRRYKALVQEIAKTPSTAGLMIYAVGAKNRQEALTKQVTFAIAKYAREGLDAPNLDTIVACQPFSDAGALQQFLGRVLRLKPGKKQPLAIFLEDDVGIVHGMMKQLRKLLREWPQESGGPLDYQQIDYPGQAVNQQPTRRNQWSK